MENSFFTLVGFEFKKMFKRKSTYLSFLMIVIVITMSMIGPIVGNLYGQIDGKAIKGISKYERMDIDRKYSREFKGYIDENKIKEFISQNKLLLSDIKDLSLSEDDIILSSQAYEKFSMRYGNIARLFRNVYAFKGKSLDYDIIDSLNDEDAKSFYDIRLEKIDELLSNGYFTSAEIKKYNELNSKVDTPFYFDNYKGYSSVMQSVPAVSIFIALAVSICIAPIFSGEYSGQTAQLILTSKYGKNKLIYAKIISSIIFSLVVSILSISLTILPNLCLYGFDGANVALQVLFPIMPYPLTMLGAVVIMSIVSIMAILLVSMLTMLMSSKLKNPFGVIIITNLILFAPIFIPVPENNIILRTIMKLLPPRMFELFDIFSEHFFVFGGFAGINQFALTSYVFLPLYCLAVSILLIPFAYRAFKNYQVS